MENRLQRFESVGASGGRPAALDAVQLKQFVSVGRWGDDKDYKTII